MKPSEIVDKALTEVLVSEDNWQQGTYHNGVTLEEATAFCLMGALYRVQNDPYVAVNKDILVIREHLRNAIGSDMIANELGVATWNDEEGRTFTDVRELLEKTRAALQEQGV